MQLEEKAIGDVTLLTVVGDLSMTNEGDVRLREKVAGLLKDGHLKLVLNLGAVTYVDSAGLGQLVQAQTRSTAAGAALKLVNPSARLRQLLNVAKIASLFDIHDSDDAALASYGTTT